MDFSFTEHEKAFRKEIADFAKKELPPNWLEIGFLSGESGDWNHTLSTVKKLGDRGWLSRTWPKEYGGAGASPIENVIFLDETAYWGIPGMMWGGFIGLMICHLANEDQKKKYLPPMAAGEADGLFCLGYSEPDAGTDLAGVKTRAVRSGDEYIINGQKIWTSLGHHARWCWLLARTDPDAPKHRGMSLMVLDMHQPGVTVKPIINIAGQHIVNEVFFDDARVPVTELIGEENQGWPLVMTALNMERSGAANSGTPRRILDELLNYVKTTTINGQLLSQDPMIRYKLANVALEIDIIRMFCYKIAFAETTGLVAAFDASMVKVFATEMSIRLMSTAMDIIGPSSYLRPGSKWASLNGQLAGAYLMSFPGRFAGGANEIQRDIIARVALGLPKAPPKA